MFLVIEVSLARMSPVEWGSGFDQVVLRAIPLNVKAMLQ